jgi:type I restriction enzyme, S subunit
MTSAPSAQSTMGTEWMGDLPARWQACRVSKVASCIQTGPFGSQLHESDYVAGGVPVINPSHIEHGVLCPDERSAVDEATALRLSRHQLMAGDIIMGRRGEIGRCAVISNENSGWLCGTGCLVVRLIDGDPRFMAAAFGSSGFGQLLTLHAVGSTMANLSPAIVGRMVVPSPPPDEQRALADFLDRETTRIDALVEDYRRLIELLNEEVTSLVLSSMNSPKTQELRLGNAARVVSRPVVQKEGELYVPIGLFNRGRGLFHKDAREMADMGDSDFFWVEEGDLIISGQFAWEGAVVLAGGEDSGCVVSHRYHVLRGRDGTARTEYLLALLSTKHGDFLLNENSRGAAGRNRPLNINSLMKENIPVPDLQTQEKIAKVVHQRSRLSRETTKQVRYLQEYRSGLISAAVTGKINIRDYSPQEAAVLCP